MKIGVESDPLLASIDFTSIALCSFTRMGRGLPLCGLNLPRRQQSRIRHGSIVTSILSKTLATALVSFCKHWFFHFKAV